MPSLDLNLPTGPARPTLPVPVAANPIAPFEGATGDGFAAVIAGLGSPRIDAPAVPFKPAIGNIMPPQGQEVAAPLPSQPPVAVEQVMVGSTAVLPAPAVQPQPAPPVSENPAAAAPAMPAGEDVPKPQPAALQVDVPDCEMPAALPSTEGASRVPAHGPWVLRISSALTPARVANLPAEVQPGPAPEPLIPAMPAPAARLIPKVANDPAVAVPEGESEEEAEPALPGAAAPQPVPVAEAPRFPVSPPIIFAQADLRPQTFVPAAPAESPAAPGPQIVLPSPQSPAQPLPFVSAPAPTDTGGAPSMGTAVPPASAQIPAAPARADAAPSTKVELPPELIRQIAQVVRQVMPDVVTAAAEPTVESIASTPQPVATPTPAQATPALSQPAPVNIGRSDWMQSMIERIAELPQADGAREARIRLLPDALGKIDVQIVQRDERMHVTLNAETAMARQLLSEAAPRLAELAEARGLRFAQTDVGGGQHQDRRSAPDQQPQTSLRQRSAQSGAAADPQSDGELIA